MPKPGSGAEFQQRFLATMAHQQIKIEASPLQCGGERGGKRDMRGRVAGERSGQAERLCTAAGAVHRRGERKRVTGVVRGRE
eukprot:6201985-Pleurochrysis_carterae.AAC.1